MLIETQHSYGDEVFFILHELKYHKKVCSTCEGDKVLLRKSDKTEIICTNCRGKGVVNHMADGYTYEIYSGKIKDIDISISKDDSDVLVTTIYYGIQSHKRVEYCEECMTFKNKIDAENFIKTKENV